MISTTYLKTTAHKANTIDKRAIHNLIPYLAWEIDRDNLNISKTALTDESNYIIVEIDGYENLAFFDCNCNHILETVQPIDRKNDKLFPVQTIEIQASYKRFY